MKGKAVSRIMLTVLLIGLLTSAFDIQPVKSDWTWTETIYIRADGSVDPDTVPISSVDNITYTLSDNIVGNVPQETSAIVVQRDNIVVDGGGYTLQGTKASASKGIDLTGRTNVTIKNMKIKVFYWGVCLYDSSNNSISGNNLTDNWTGVALFPSYYNSISANNITNNLDGVALFPSSNYNTISGNNITANNEHGVYLYESSSNSISGNYIANNYGGIGLEGSSSNSISGNNITNNWWDGFYLDSASYNSISGNSITNNPYGIRLFGSSNYNTISGNNITNNWGDGIDLDSASYNSISGNSITNNAYGIYLFGSSNYNTISGNNITDSGYGVHLGSSSNNSISGNNITNIWWDGIDLDSASYNSISGNSITNSFFGVVLWSSSYCSISGNNITNNGHGVLLDSSSYCSISENNITNNLVGVILQSSSNNSISGNNLTDNWTGVALFPSYYNSISGNNIANNLDGVTLFPSSNYNTISGNNITNNWCGIELEDSSNNKFYHNNFIDNTQQVHIWSSGYANFWDDGYPSGGNYWSDYTGVDLHSGPNQDQPDGDGIGDTEYVIDPLNQDRYPLMYPWGVRDVAITSVTVSAAEVLQGDLVNITVTAINEGRQTETFTVTSYANLTIIGDETVTDLAPDAEITLTFSWNTTEAGVGSYIIKAEASVVEDETHTADNVYVDGAVEVIVGYPPVAVIVAPMEGCVSEVIAFSGAGSYDPDGGLIVGCLWDFGDGSFSTELNPTHSYALAGTYEVTLVVTDDEGQVSDPVSHVIEIKSLGEALQELIETIKGWNLDKGIEASLTYKLEEAILLLDKGNENGAIHKLMDLINQVEALRGQGKLEDWQANYLVTEVQRIMDLI